MHFSRFLRVRDMEWLWGSHMGIDNNFSNQSTVISWYALTHLKWEGVHDFSGSSPPWQSTWIATKSVSKHAVRVASIRLAILADITSCIIHAKTELLSGSSRKGSSRSTAGGGNERAITKAALSVTEGEQEMSQRDRSHVRTSNSDLLLSPFRRHGGTCGLAVKE